MTLSRSDVLKITSLEDQELQAVDVGLDLVGLVKQVYKAGTV